VIVTGEVLDDGTREIAKRMFSKVIDKMRCWDGGLGFYECSYGRKHVYDELSYLEILDDQLVSTDFFNFCHPFLRYANQDAGIVSEGLCECGVYGRYFVRFDGRETQCLLLDDKVIPGNAIMQEVNNFLFFSRFNSIIFQQSFHKKHGRDNLLQNYEVKWAIRQDHLGELCFYYDCDDLSLESEEYLKDAVTYILLRKVEGLETNDSDRICSHDINLKFVKQKMDSSIKNISIKSDFFKLKS
jgi:hypothetical protein